MSSWITEDSGTTPYVTAKDSNNAISSYISYDNTQIEKGNSIMIGGKTSVITYQEEDYFSNDSHNLALYLKDKKFRTEIIQLFMVTCLKKSLNPLYSWGNSISNRKIQKDTMQLPTLNNKIDYDFMETVIRGIQKLVIKGVVQYKDRIIAETKKVVSE